MAKNKKINLLFDATILSNGCRKDASRSGLFVVALNTFKYFIKKTDIHIYLYCQSTLINNLKKELEKDFPDKKFRIYDENLLLADFEKKQNKFEQWLHKKFGTLSQKITRAKRKRHKIIKSVYSMLRRIIVFLLYLTGNRCYLRKINVYLSPLYCIPKSILKCKTIHSFCILYDTIPFLYPQYFPEFVAGKHWYNQIISPEQKNVHYFAISENTKNDFLRFVPHFKPSSITVSHLAISDNLLKSTDSQQDKNVRKKYNIPSNKKYILSLCTLEPRKNIDKIVNAFLEFKKQNHLKDVCLVLAGGKWNNFKITTSTPSIIHTGYVDDSDLATLYSNALCFVYASEYEGFGLPPLEAMACGCPVICANNSSLPEVVGNAALLINCHKIEDYINALTKYYFNSHLRKTNIDAGFIQAAKFSWNKFGQILYDTIMDKVHHKMIAPSQNLDEVKILKNQIKETEENVKYILKQNYATIDALMKADLNHRIQNLMNVKSSNLTKLSRKNIVQISTHKTVCGIADYCQFLIEGISKLSIGGKNDVISLDVPLIHQNTYEHNIAYFNDIAERCKDYDIIIIQYHFAFFVSAKTKMRTASLSLFYKFLKDLRGKYPEKNIIVFLHSALGLKDDSVSLLNHHMELSKLAKIPNIKYIANTVDIMTDAKCFGIDTFMGFNPVQKKSNQRDVLNKDLESKIKKHLSLNKKSCILTMMGFFNRFKQYDVMLDILSLLPDNYKFLAVGGIHPNGDDGSFEKFVNKMKQKNLEHRVFVSGLYENEDLYTYFSLSTIMCAPYSISFKDGSASVPLLMQAKKPIVAFDISPISLLNIQTKNTPICLVPYGNLEAFADKIKNIYGNSNEYKKWEKQICEYGKNMNIETLAKLTLKTITEED